MSTFEVMVLASLLYMAVALHRIARSVARVNPYYRYWLPLDWREARRVLRRLRRSSQP